MTRTDVRDNIYSSAKKTRPTNGVGAPRTSLYITYSSNAIHFYYTYFLKMYQAILLQKNQQKTTEKGQKMSFYGQMGYSTMVVQVFYNTISVFNSQ